MPLPSTALANYSQRVNVTDSITGMPFVSMPYFIRLKSGTVYFGQTDVDGNTDTVFSNDAETGETYLGHLALIEIAKFKAKK